jgi:peptide/nickel transport system ATP-binding protein
VSAPLLRPDAAPAPEVARLELDRVRVDGRQQGRPITVVEDLSFRIRKGRMLALVGESGCGKSLTAAAILGLLPWGFRVSSGRVLVDGTDTLALPPGEWRRLRGAKIGAVFQNPLSALNPSLPIWTQVVEAARLEEGLGRAASRRRALELLELVGVPEAARRLDDYPHHFSGGMRQRVAIAIALARNPAILIADEPTTALDLITQAQILRLLNRLQKERDLAVLFITHDLSLVAEYADDVLVMYAGRGVEVGEARLFFDTPLHPYSRALLGAVPRPTAPEERLTDIEGVPPSPQDYPPGCRFAPRCPRADERCRREPPPPRTGADVHFAFCHHPHTAEAR